MHDRNLLIVYSGWLDNSEDEDLIKFRQK